MKKILLLLILNLNLINAQNQETTKVNQVLDYWHKSASEAHFDDYFSQMTTDCVFIGTDATENWNRKQFEAFAKPYFDKGKAWSFTAIERHVFFNKEKNMAWFDELLNTQMKICRGSGVLVKIKENWKIQHYVLSMTVPNDNSDEVVKTKSPIEDKLIEKFKTSK